MKKVKLKLLPCYIGMYKTDRKIAKRERKFRKEEGVS